MYKPEALPETFYYPTSPRNDCWKECPLVLARKTELKDTLSQAYAEQRAGNISEQNTEAGYTAISGINKLVTDTWECAGRMDMQYKSEDPCRNPVFTKTE